MGHGVGRGWVMRCGRSRSWSGRGVGHRSPAPGIDDLLKKRSLNCGGVGHKNKNFGPGSVQLW